MLDQLIQIGIALFAGACAVMVVRTVVEVLPELLGLDAASLRGEPVPALARSRRPSAPRRAR